MKIMIVILEIETINPFVPNAPFLYPLKTSENRKVFLCFHGGRERVHWVRMGYVNSIKSHHTETSTKVVL